MEVNIDEPVKRPYCSLNDHFGSFRSACGGSKRFIPKCSKSFANDFLRVHQYL